MFLFAIIPGLISYSSTTKNFGKGNDRLEDVEEILAVFKSSKRKITMFNPSAPNHIYICRTAQLTSRRCILNIYSTNILTEYCKHAADSPFFLSLSFFKMPFIS